MLLLFDEININIFSILKKRLRKLAKNIDESELWITRLDVPDNMLILRATIKDFQDFNDLIFENSTVDEAG